jgi:tRNA A64-2'-O-ribosylphosphate transferase
MRDCPPPPALPAAQVPQPEQLAFTPVYLVSASEPVPHARRCCRVGADDEAEGGESFLYEPGAGDDEEAWAGGLTPAVFWAHADEILSAGSARAADVVRHLVGAQPSHQPGRRRGVPTRAAASDGAPGLHNLPPRGLRAADPSAVRPAAGGAFVVARGLLLHGGGGGGGAYGCPPPGGADSLLLLLPPGAPLGGGDHGWSSAAVVRVESSKAARGSLCSALRPALRHVFDTAWRGHSLLVCDAAGGDAGVCVVLAALLCMFAAVAEGGADNDLPAFCGRIMEAADGSSGGCNGSGDGEAARMERAFEACVRNAAATISKDAVRVHLAAVSARFPAARPTRGSLKQVFNFFVDAAGGRRPGGAASGGDV